MAEQLLKNKNKEEAMREIERLTQILQDMHVLMRDIEDYRILKNYKLKAERFEKKINLLKKSL